MRHFRLLSIAALSAVAVGSLHAQATAAGPAVLRPGASGRATSEVTLSYPRPAGAMPAMRMPATAAPAKPAASGMTAMPGMSPSPAAAPAASPPPVAAVAPEPKPLVIRVDYGQPHLRGRMLHTDSLVPYDKAWRMGANGSTTLTTDVDLVVGGVSLVKGKYVLYTIPGRTTWKLVVQRDANQTPMQYSDSNDVARIDLRHTTLAAPIESLTMWLIPSLQPGPARGELRFAWGNDQLSTDWTVR